jgi:RNA polymerase sigma-70 factor (ECF subfamily)
VPTLAEVRPKFEEIYETHLDFVFANARRLGVRDASVDDVVQDVFVIVHRRLSDFDGRTSLRSWIFGILSRVVRDYRRTRRRKESQLSPLDAEVSNTLPAAANGPEPLALAEQNEAVSLLFRIMDSLDEEKREILILSELEQMTMPEIAAALNLNVNTLYSRLRSARKAFSEAHLREKARALPRVQGRGR